MLSDDSLQCWGAQSGEFDNTTNSHLNPHQLTFTDAAHVAYTEQDFDGDGIRNLFDTHQTGDNDGDGTLDTDDDYPTNPARWTDCADGQFGRLTCVDASPGYSASDSRFNPNRDANRELSSHLLSQASCLDASAGHYVDSSASLSRTQCPTGYSTSA